MSSEGLLGVKKLRKIERVTGITPIRGWAWYPYFEFRDAEDVHYNLDIRTGEWEVIDCPRHYTSCRIMRENGEIK